MASHEVIMRLGLSITTLRMNSNPKTDLTVVQPRLALLKPTASRDLLKPKLERGSRWVSREPSLLHLKGFLIPSKGNPRDPFITLGYHFKGH